MHDKKNSETLVFDLTAFFSFFAISTLFRMQFRSYFLSLPWLFQTKNVQFYAPLQTICFFWYEEIFITGGPPLVRSPLVRIPLVRILVL